MPLRLTLQKRSALGLAANSENGELGLMSIIVAIGYPEMRPKGQCAHKTLTGGKARRMPNWLVGSYSVIKHLAEFSKAKGRGQRDFIRRVQRHFPR